MSSQTANEMKRQGIIEQADGDSKGSTEVDLRPKSAGSGTRSQGEVDSGYEAHTVEVRDSQSHTGDKHTLSLNTLLTIQGPSTGYDGTESGRTTCDTQGDKLPLQAVMSLPKMLSENCVLRNDRTQSRTVHPEDSPTTDCSSEDSTSLGRRGMKVCCCKVDLAMLEMLKVLKKKEDEYDLFAKSLVPRLRQLSDTEYLDAQKSILDAIHNAKRSVQRWSSEDGATDQD